MCATVIYVYIQTYNTSAKLQHYNYLHYKYNIIICYTVLMLQQFIIDYDTKLYRISP